MWARMMDDADALGAPPGQASHDMYASTISVHCGARNKSPMREHHFAAHTQVHHLKTDHRNDDMIKFKCNDACSRPTQGSNGGLSDVRGPRKAKKDDTEGTPEVTRIAEPVRTLGPRDAGVIGDRLPVTWTWCRPRTPGWARWGCNIRMSPMTWKGKDVMVDATTDAAHVRVAIRGHTIRRFRTPRTIAMQTCGPGMRGKSQRVESERNPQTQPGDGADRWYMIYEQEIVMGTHTCAFIQYIRPTIPRCVGKEPTQTLRNLGTNTRLEHGFSCSMNTRVSAIMIYERWDAIAVPVVRANDTSQFGERAVGICRVCTTRPWMRGLGRMVAYATPAALLKFEPRCIPTMWGREPYLSKASKPHVGLELDAGNRDDGPWFMAM
ncbi:hypothetical protein HD554DRAFT_2040621 [Boletus coccyginus]|nr:hypothetical protein HD554DRAFT_2040621 [Boletus coccyginus]